MQRPRRLRVSKLMRDMVVNVSLHRGQFVQPVFVSTGNGIKRPISSMPGIHHFSTDTLLKETDILLKSGLKRFLLFGVGEEKDLTGSASASDRSAVATAVKALRKTFGNDILIMTDVCLCAYTTHGHCGVLHKEEIVNDETLPLLANMASAHAEAGADVIAPSDMMDGRIGFIRNQLDEQGFVNTGMMSYSVKYASSYYGPFRDAAASAPQAGDRKSYQMDFRRDEEAINEAMTDVGEGADIVMVKPALAYLDIIRAVRENAGVPVACYNVSGEYAMVKLAAQAGLADERSLVMENMYAFARAGADIIISYHSADIFLKDWLEH